VDGVGVGVDDLVRDALVEVPQDLDERAGHPGGLVERHHVVGCGHPFPEPALQLRHHGPPRPRTRAPRRPPHPPRGSGEGRRRPRRERERGRRRGLHALGWLVGRWWLRARFDSTTDDEFVGAERRRVGRDYGRSFGGGAGLGAVEKEGPPVLGGMGRDDETAPRAQPPTTCTAPLASARGAARGPGPCPLVVGRARRGSRLPQPTSRVRAAALAALGERRGLAGGW